MLVPIGAQESHAASKYVDLELQWEDGRISRIQTLHKDGVTYGSFYSLGSMAQLYSGIDADKTVVLKSDQKHIAIRLGSNRDGTQ